MGGGDCFKKNPLLAPLNIRPDIIKSGELTETVTCALPEPLND